MPVASCRAGRQPRRLAWRRTNVGTMEAAHNRDGWFDSYRVGAGNGEAAGAGGAGLGFGFFGRIGLRAALGGGPAGCSSPMTGLGSIEVDGGVEKSPGIWMTWTGTVSGWNRGKV